jgi:histidinol-phosphate/aromatic aminotransferase/cobyric acid decarboxylase-like protein/adenosyl cobinamide kinase/adenosyl cobinamide phosphate guanylyltransferase
MALVLVVGGVRSGKSEVGERIAAAAGAPVCYLATGRASDPEMAERIECHQARRPAGWRTICSPDPARAEVAPGETLLVDGVAPWLSARMGEEGLWTDEAVAPLGEAGRAAYRRVLEGVRTFAVEAARRPGLTVTVAEESSLGVIPIGAGLRRYLDLAGEAIQLLARHADRVVLVVAGRAIDLDLDDHLPRTLRHDRPISPWPTTAPLPRPVDLPRGRADPRPGRADPRPGRADPRPGRADLTPGGAGLPPDRTDLLRLHGDAMVSPRQLDFAVSVVAGGPPAWMRHELASALDRLGGYPDERSAVRAVAARHGRSTDEVVATNGSADGFWLLAQVLRPRLAVVVHPSFTEPEAALRAAGHPVERAFRDPNDFTLDPCAVPDEADLVVVCNPNNPTGTLDPAAVLARLAKPGRVLVVDEAFMEFVPGEPESLAKPGADVPGLVVVRSLTKLWSLPGLRAGYLLAPPGIAAAVRETRQPWSVNAPACAALAVWARRTATPGGAEVTAMARDVEAARADLAAGLTALPGVRVWPSAANFLLLRVPDGPSVRAGLARRGIAVRRADTFPGLGHHHLRVAVRSPPDNRLLVESLAEVLDSTPTSAPV